MFNDFMNRQHYITLAWSSFFRLFRMPVSKLLLCGELCLIFASAALAASSPDRQAGASTTCRDFVHGVASFQLNYSQSLQDAMDAISKLPLGIATFKDVTHILGTSFLRNEDIVYYIFPEEGLSTAATNKVCNKRSAIYPAKRLTIRLEPPRCEYSKTDREVVEAISLDACFIKIAEYCYAASPYFEIVEATPEWQGGSVSEWDISRVSVRKEENTSAFFNAVLEVPGTGEAAKGCLIVGKDDERWRAAVAAALKQPLKITTVDDIKRIFGNECLSQEWGNDGQFSFSYGYPEHDITLHWLTKNGQKNTKQLTVWRYVLLTFSFNQKKKLARVSIVNCYRSGFNLYPHIGMQESRF